MDVSKMKVAELKTELKTRGLSTAGNKQELMERLQDSVEHYEGIHGGEGSLLVMDEDVDEDDEVDEEVEDELDSASLVSSSDLHKLDASINPQIRRATITSGNKRAASECEKISGKKIVLNRTVAVVPLSSVQTDVSQNKGLVAAVEPRPSTTGQNGATIKLDANLSPKERLEMRAKKFGMDLSDSSAFHNIVDLKENKSIHIGNNKVTSVSSNIDTLKKRAERFGSSVSTIMEQAEREERLKKRQERFGAVKPIAKSAVTTTNCSTSSGSTNSIDEKKKLRAERFKLN